MATNTDLHRVNRIFEKNKGLNHLTALADLSKIQIVLDAFQSVSRRKTSAIPSHNLEIGMPDSHCNKPYFGFLMDIFTAMGRRISQPDVQAPGKDQAVKMQLDARKCLQNMVMNFHDSDGDFWPAKILEHRGSQTRDEKLGRYTLNEMRALGAVIVEKHSRSPWLQSATREQRNFFCMLADTAGASGDLKEYQKKVLELF